jgi:hypothetical protein
MVIKIKDYFDFYLYLQFLGKYTSVNVLATNSLNMNVNMGYSTSFRRV